MVCRNIENFLLFWWVACNALLQWIKDNSSTLCALKHSLALLSFNIHFGFIQFTRKGVGGGLLSTRDGVFLPTEFVPDKVEDRTATNYQLSTTKLHKISIQEHLIQIEWLKYTRNIAHTIRTLRNTNCESEGQNKATATIRGRGLDEAQRLTDYKRDTTKGESTGWCSHRSTIIQSDSQQRGSDCATSQQELNNLLQRQVARRSA